MHDLEPATRSVGRMVEGIRDEQLNFPTPCADTTLGTLLDHVSGLSRAFTAAARKTGGPEVDRAPSADASNLEADWRRLIPERLGALAAAWREAAAWTGMTRAGGVDLPGEVAGAVVTNELVIHGWDLAVASGQSY